MGAPECLFEYAMMQLVVGAWTEPGVRKLSVRTFFPVVDGRAIQNDPTDVLFDTASEIHDVALMALGPKLAELGDEGWEVVVCQFSTTGFPFAQALLKRRIVKI